MVKWRYYNPVRISLCNNWIERINSIIETGQKKKVLLISQKELSPQRWVKDLSTNKRRVICYDSVEENPSIESCQIAIDFASKIQSDCIVAIGGGSAIDTAKTVKASIISLSCNIYDLLSKGLTKKKDTILAAIPTTHGTGSEVTPWATVWDKKNKKKLSLSSPLLYPDYAVLDPNLTLTLPFQLSVSSSLDALSHSFEALWNKHSNPISDRFAFESIKMVFNHLQVLKENMQRYEMRSSLLTASLLAGLAFSNTETGAAHSISYPLTLRYGIPHGIACSMPLIPLLKINANAISNKIEALLAVLGLDSITDLIKKIESIIDNNIEFSLHKYGVKEEELPKILDECFTKGRIENNIVELTEKDVLNILKDIY